MNGRLRPRHTPTDTDRAAMFALLSAHFEGVDAQQFSSDLDEKNWIVWIEDERGALVGFSTLLAETLDVCGETINVIYSGDTIVSRSAWGSAAFPRAWIHAVYSLRDTLPPGRLLWLLLTSGFRTYRFLPVFWREFYPCVNRATPPNWKSILDLLAERRYGDQYDATTSLVRFAKPQRLIDELRDIPAGRCRDPHVDFFLSLNPGHVHGDELACIADLDPSNLTAVGRRVVYGAAR